MFIQGVRKIAGCIVLCEESFDLVLQLCIARAHTRKVRGAFIRREFNRGLKNLVDMLPAFGGHDEVKSDD